MDERVGEWKNTPTHADMPCERERETRDTYNCSFTVSASSFGNSAKDNYGIG